ncbi:hypothetical protein CsSME_00007634 [Camellia sinensis var. sinensis]
MADVMEDPLIVTDENTQVSFSLQQTRTNRSFSQQHVF